MSGLLFREAYVDKTSLACSQRMIAYLPQARTETAHPYGRVEGKHEPSEKEAERQTSLADLRGVI